MGQPSFYHASGSIFFFSFYLVSYIATSLYKKVIFTNAKKLSYKVLSPDWLYCYVMSVVIVQNNTTKYKQCIRMNILEIQHVSCSQTYVYIER